MREISNDKIDKLFEFDGDDPVVQNIKKIDGRVILSFLDVVFRDKAQDLLNEKQGTKNKQNKEPSPKCVSLCFGP
jgi:hypothetical protein